MAGWLADVASFRKCLETSSGARPQARASGGTCPHNDQHAKGEKGQILAVCVWIDFKKCRSGTFLRDTARFEYMIGWERQAFQLGSCAYGTVRAVDRAKVAQKLKRTRLWWNLSSQ